MTYYIYLISLSLAFLVLTRRSRILHDASLFIGFLGMWILASFKDVTVGNDTISYAKFFENYKVRLTNGNENLGLFVSNGFEYGFNIYTRSAAIITENLTAYFAFSYAFIYYSVYSFIKKYSSDYLLSYYIYLSLFFFGSMSLMRQTIAISILLWGFKYIENRKAFKYLLVVLGATLFHQISIVSAAIYFLYTNKFTWRTIAYCVALAGAGLLLIQPIIITLASFNPRYEFYLERINTFSAASIVGLLLLMSIWGLQYYLYKNTDKKLSKLNENRMAFFMKVSSLSVATAFIALRVNSLDRLILFFLIYSVISIPHAFATSKKIRRSWLIKLCLVLCLLSYTLSVLIMRPQWYNVTIYKFIAN